MEEGRTDFSIKYSMFTVEILWTHPRVAFFPAEAVSFLILGLAFGLDPSEIFSEFVVSTVVVAVTLGFTEGGITGTGRCGGGGAALPPRPFISLQWDELNSSPPNKQTLGRMNPRLHASNPSRG